MLFGFYKEQSTLVNITKGGSNDTPVYTKMIDILRDLSGLFHSELVLGLPEDISASTGKTFTVTGPNIGLGNEAARKSAILSASKLILACHTASRASKCVLAFWWISNLSSMSTKTFSFAS